MQFFLPAHFSLPIERRMHHVYCTNHAGESPCSRSLRLLEGPSQCHCIRVRHFRRSIAVHRFKWCVNNGRPCLRPYHVENTSSRPITEVKQRRARLVLGWVTAWEYRVL